MNTIYSLVGKCIQLFQMLENCLALLVYYHECDTISENKKLAKQLALEHWGEYDAKTLGQKLHRIKELQFWENQNDLIVFDYLVSNRNYLVHKYFFDNDFDTPEQIKENTIQLETIFKDVSFIVTALQRMLADENKKHK